MTQLRMTQLRQSDGLCDNHGLRPQQQQGAPGSLGGHFHQLLGAIGRPEFADVLGACLGDICEPDYIHTFEFREGRIRVMSSVSLGNTNQRDARRQAQVYTDRQYWRIDPVMQEAGSACSTRPNLYRQAHREAKSVELGNFWRGMELSERIMLCGRSDYGNTIGLSIMRSETHGPLTSAECNRLETTADTLYSMFCKHHEVLWRLKSPADSLSVLDSIEQRMALASPAICPRETQVGARSLFGMSTSEIAEDLGIGRETVITYKKRLYERLAICSQRELTLWYLRLFEI